jgi:hypothetical protein
MRVFIRGSVLSNREELVNYWWSFVKRRTLAWRPRECGGLRVAGDAILDIWDLWNKEAPARQEKLNEEKRLAQHPPDGAKREVEKTVTEVAGDPAWQRIRPGERRPGCPS